MRHAAGIASVAELQRIGAVAAFLRVKRAGLKPSLNLLYALEGALTGTHWARLSDDERGRLLIAVDGAEDMPSRTRGD